MGGNSAHHAKAIVACDFLVTVTATFRLLYVLVVVHHESRRLVHVKLTGHPTAAWTYSSCVRQPLLSMLIDI